MNLFTPMIFEKDFHPNFKSILQNSSQDQMKTLIAWSEGFPDRDNKFIKEFQSTFNSSFWELYLYRVFREYQFAFNWDHMSPDFNLSFEGKNFIVEATTANKGNDERVNEWEKQEDIYNVFNPKAYDHYLDNMNEANRYSMIRLGNSILSKYRKYENSYSKLPHVQKKPFVIALAPFEQPFFYYQYNRPIMALLYDFYVDEEVSRKNPQIHKSPPTVYLNSIEKDSGAEIPLGFFNDESMKEVSAIIFNPLATWSKVGSYNRSLNFTVKNRLSLCQIEQELIEDGLFIFHNPFAKYPLDKTIFRRNRVCQVYLDDGSEKINEDDIIFVKLENNDYLILEFGDKHMMSRNFL